MYYDFFGFREPPFSIAPDPRYLYLSERHKEALAHLMYGVNGQGGFIVITGEVGTGKTTVSRCFIENAPDHVDIALILNPRLSARELLSSICGEMEVPHRGGASIKEMVDLINEDLLKAHAAGRHKVLMIDEAQNLSADVLEQLRLLTNLETAEKKLLQIVLLGQPELQQILALPELRQLNQRVTARYHLNAISKSELPDYLRYRLSVAGMRGDIFTAPAMNRLYRESQGIPRLINLISDRALLGAYAEGEHEITTSHIRQAAREVRGTIAGPVSGKSGRPAQSARYVTLAASLLLAIIGTTWLIERWTFTGKELKTELSASPAQAGLVERGEPEPSPMVSNSEVDSAESESAQSVTSEELDTFRFGEHALSKAEAFRSLFKLWGRDYSPELFPNACEFAREDGLDCLFRQGARRSLEFLDRPVILELKDDSGNPGYVVLSMLDGAVAEIALPDGARKVSFESIEPYWFGDYSLLWSRPDFLARGAGNGGRAEQLWIGARMMELADRFSSSKTENGRLKRMPADEQVRWYQDLKGLTVDGIAGAMTIIQIHNDLGGDMPRLAPKPSSGGR